MKYANFVILFWASLAYGQKFDQLGLTPQMGWNTYNTFAGNFNEKLIREMADVIVSSGLKDAGYVYIIIDDNWTGPRDSLGFLTVDKSRFPSGIKPLSEYVHSRGLKLGLYSDAGYKTCGGYVASRGHEFQDALTFARMGADYLKYDWCNTEGIDARGAYQTMSDALRAAGRPIFFSMCEWGNNKPWLWAKNIGHSWRTTGDITACWNCVDTHGGTYNSWGVMKILDMQEGLRCYAGPGHWNDPDMLEVGNGMTLNEDRAHFSMWSMLAAPLIAGNDLRKTSKATLDILTNADVIAVDQDSLGIQGFKYSAKDSVEIWFKPLVRNNWAMCILNRSESSRPVRIDWKNEAVADSLSGRSVNTNTTEYLLTDLWTKNNLGTTVTTLNAKVASHDVLMLRLTKK